MFTIEDLAQGKCAVKNDGTLEELKKVLNKAFPNDTCSIQGLATHYYADRKDKWTSTSIFFKNLPAQSAKDFLINDFILPEKWCIKSNSDTINIIGKFWDDSLFLKNVYTNESCIKAYKDRYWYSHNLTSGNAFGKDGGSNHVSKYKRNNYIEITFEQFKKYVLKQDNMNRKFPFYLNPDHAQTIINIACSEWKNKLAAKWASAIVLSKQIEVSEEFYREMRKACTAAQHTLLDSIFGKDVVADLSILNNTDIFYITCTSGFSYLFKGDPFSIGVTGWNYRSNRLLSSDRPLCSKEDIEYLRKASIEEIKFYNEKCNPYKDGDLVWVKISPAFEEWRLRYTNGIIKDNKLQCYEGQNKTGNTGPWEIYKLASGITLPE